MTKENRYLDGSYLELNPGWHCSDSKWKSQLVSEILERHGINPTSVLEVGCGSGYVLRHLSNKFPNVKLVGYDISPQAEVFWNQSSFGSPEIKFYLQDFIEHNLIIFDVLLMLDVFEHVQNPFGFLEQSKYHAELFVFHIPLDLSVQSVLRKSPLLDARRSNGHLNFYTKDLALETLTDCGYEIIDWSYTGASFYAPERSVLTKFMNIPRVLLSFINKDFSVRLLGGETLLVLAK